MVTNKGCQDIRGCSEEELRRLCRERGFPDFRARQIFVGVQGKGARSWEDIPSLSADVRSNLCDILVFEPVQLIRQQISQDGTSKYLLGLADGESIETVLIPDFAARRWTLCLSTQVGCPVGCIFCATGKSGFRRNLSAGEIVSQVLEVVRVNKIMRADFKLNNVVFMGMGEPFLNERMLMGAVNLLNSEHGLNIGMRKMTISTCGVVPGIRHLAEINSQIGLAVSLHSSFDETRNELVPMNKKYPLAVLMEACREYCNRTHRRITFEMALDQDTCTTQEALALAKRLRGIIAHVNLIPVNPVAASELKRPERKSMIDFRSILEGARIPVSIREEMGADIEAACGQLSLNQKDPFMMVHGSDACEPIIKM